MGRNGRLGGRPDSSSSCSASFTARRSLYFFIALFFYPEAKGAGELASAGKGGGMDGVVQFPAEGDLEMVLDMATAAKTIGDR